MHDREPSDADRDLYAQVADLVRKHPDDFKAAGNWLGREKGTGVNLTGSGCCDRFRRCMHEHDLRSAVWSITC